MSEPAEQRPLRVTLDVSAVPKDPTGGGRYIIELVNALSVRDDLNVHLVCRRDDAGKWTHGHASLPASSVTARAPRPRLARLAWEQTGLPLLLRRLGPDVHHGPHYTMPLLGPVPSVVSIHDLTYFSHPEWHERNRVVFFRRATALAVRRAGALVCVSETTARALRDLFDVRVPMFVAPHGVDHGRFRPDEASPGEDTSSLQRLGLDPGRPYVAFLGTIEPRKGVAGLVRAFGRVAAADADVDLVVAGRQGWGTDEVTREVERSPVRSRIHMLGYVPEESLPSLLRRAAVVAYPSFEEGAGLPALEALASGAPLVTTEGTAMAEMAGEAAVVVPPGDDEALAEAILAVLRARDSAADRDHRRAGLEIAGRRTWAAAAATHVEAYRTAAVAAPDGRH